MVTSIWASLRYGFGVFGSRTVMLRFYTLIACVCHCHCFLGPVCLRRLAWLPPLVRRTVNNTLCVGPTPALAVCTAETSYCHSAIHRSLCLLGPSLTDGTSLRSTLTTGLASGSWGRRGHTGRVGEKPKVGNFQSLPPRSLTQSIALLIIAQPR